MEAERRAAAWLAKVLAFALLLNALPLYVLRERFEYATPFVWETFLYRNPPWQAITSPGLTGSLATLSLSLIALGNMAMVVWPSAEDRSEKTRTVARCLSPMLLAMTALPPFAIILLPLFVPVGAAILARTMTVGRGKRRFSSYGLLSAVLGVMLGGAVLLALDCLNLVLIGGS